MLVLTPLTVLVTDCTYAIWEKFSVYYKNIIIKWIKSYISLARSGTERPCELQSLHMSENTMRASVTRCKMRKPHWGWRVQCLMTDELLLCIWQHRCLLQCVFLHMAHEQAHFHSDRRPTDRRLINLLSCVFIWVHWAWLGRCKQINQMADAMQCRCDGDVLSVLSALFRLDWWVVMYTIKTLLDSLCFVWDIWKI